MTNEKCKVKIGEKEYSGEFMGLFQFSDVIGESMFVGGHKGGTIEYPVAVVRVGNMFKRFPVDKIVFEDDNSVNEKASKFLESLNDTPGAEGIKDLLAKQEISKMSEEIASQSIKSLNKFRGVNNMEAGR